MRDKARRQAAILRLVSERRIASQAELVAHLAEEGLESTQSSVSRDLRELGVVRLGGRYVPAGAATAAPEGPVPPETALITSMQSIGANLIVIKTPPGLASAVAVRIDQQQIVEVAGTIAGDDTIFLAVASRSSQGRVIAALQRRLPATTRPVP